MGFQKKYILYKVLLGGVGGYGSSMSIGHNFNIVYAWQFAEFFVCLLACVRINSLSIVCYSISLSFVRVCIAIQILSQLVIVDLRIDDSKRIFVCQSKSLFLLASHT